MIVKFLNTLKNNPNDIEFGYTIEVIDSIYHFIPTSFKNGKLRNELNENNGSCKIFSFAKKHDFSKVQTLQCFGEYYREDVLKHPNNKDHQNIRNFIKNGWKGIQFETQALKEK